MVQVVTAAKFAGLGVALAGVVVDDSAEVGEVITDVEELQPAIPSCRNTSLEPWNDAWEVVRQDAAELTEARGEREALLVLRVVAQYAEDRANCGGASRQVAAHAVDDQQCVIAISPGS